MLKREVQKAENESNRNTTIITEYKQVTYPRMLSRMLNGWRELRSDVWDCQWEILCIPSTLYEGVSKSPRTMLITCKSPVVHEFPARVCCGSVLWVSVPSGVVACGSVWLIYVSLCVYCISRLRFSDIGGSGSWWTKGVHQVLCEIG